MQKDKRVKGNKNKNNKKWCKRDNVLQQELNK